MSGYAAGAQPVLAALTARERAMFLGHDHARETLAAGDMAVTWVDPTELTATAWLNTLRAVKPAAVLTAWAAMPLPEAWLGEAECPLRYVCHLTGSVRRLVPRSFLERGGIVTNWGTLAAGDVAEHALLLALGALRGLPGWRSYIARAPAERSVADLGTRSLRGCRVGLHGFGAIARALVALLRPFQVEVAAYSAGVPAAVMTELGVRPAESLEALFGGSEVLFECEALTEASTGAVTAVVLDALPPGAVFVNVGRGRVVADEAALRARARSGRLRVALDVLADEPIGADSPWFDCAEVLLSPHIGGPVVGSYPKIGDHAVANLRRWRVGEALDSRVTLPVYDRAT